MTKIIENDDHEDFFELLPLYVNQSLDNAKMLAIEKHLKNCAECQAELAFEKSLQESINANETDVTEISQRNLVKFNAQLDRRLTEVSRTEVSRTVELPTEASVAKSDLPARRNHAGGSPLLERIFDCGRSLLTYRPAIGALAVGCCAVVVVSALSGSIDSGDTQSPLRSCEHVVKHHELRVVTTNSDSVSGSAKDILQEYFPDAESTIEVLDEGGIVVSVTGDTCMVPLLVNDLEKLSSVNSVTVN